MFCTIDTSIQWGILYWLNSGLDSESPEQGSAQLSDPSCRMFTLGIGRGSDRNQSRAPRRASVKYPSMLVTVPLHSTLGMYH